MTRHLTVFSAVLGALIMASSAQAVTLLFDAGRPDSLTANVNSIHWSAQDVADAIAADGSGATGISLTVDLGSSTGFNEIGPNDSGTNAPGSPAGDLFDGEMTNDALFGHSSNFNTGAPRDSVIYDIAGLNPGELYDFTFYGSRGTVSDVRSALYTVDGVNSGSDVLDAGNNVSNVAQVLSIEASALGTLTLTIGADASNTNGSGFFYLGAMQISSTIPEPTSALLIGLGTLTCGLVRRRV